MNYDDWRRICDDCGVTDEKDRDDLLENLGHLGRVVCFPRDPRLRHLGVLNPEWVTRGIYPLLVETKLAAQGGMIKPGDLCDLLPKDRYPKERHSWLLELMKAFELVFEDAHGNLLLPAQLPMDSPPWAQPHKWSDAETLHLELRYDTVLPESVISQFIVRRHKEARQPGEWWRHGIALKRGKCEALVRAHTAENEATIELRLRGPRQERRDFLASIRETLRDPRDSTPPELHVVLGKDCAPKYTDLLIHADAGKTMLDLIIEGRSVLQPLAPILDMIEAPAQQKASHDAALAIHLHNTIHNENRPDMSKKDYINTGTMTGSALGDHNTVTTSNSFNTGIDPAALATLLSALKQETATLPQETAAKVRPQLEQLEAGAEMIAAESKKPEPNRGLLTLTRNGMIAAAKTCAQIAPSLLKTATAIAEWINKI